MGSVRLAAISSRSLSVSTTSFHPPAAERKAAISASDFGLKGVRFAAFLTGEMTATSWSARRKTRGRFVRRTSSAMSASDGILVWLISIGANSCDIFVLPLPVLLHMFRAERAFRWPQQPVEGLTEIGRGMLLRLIRRRFRRIDDLAWSPVALDVGLNLAGLLASVEQGLENRFRNGQGYAVLKDTTDSLLNWLGWSVAEHRDVGHDRLIGQVKLVGREVNVSVLHQG